MGNVQSKGEGRKGQGEGREGDGAESTAQGRERRYRARIEVKWCGRFRERRRGVAGGKYRAEDFL